MGQAGDRELRRNFRLGKVRVGPGKPLGQRRLHLLVGFRRRFGGCRFPFRQGGFDDRQREVRRGFRQVHAGFLPPAFHRRVPQEGRQHPAVVAGNPAGGRRGRLVPAGIEGGGLPDGPAQVLFADAEDQPLLRPRQGDVEKPHLLRQHVPLLPGSGGGVGDGPVPAEGFPLDPLHPEAHLGVEDGKGGEVGVVKPLAGPGQRHHREFQPFGAVHRHNPDGVLRLGHRDRRGKPAPLFRQRPDVGDKAGELAVPARLVVGSVLEEQPEVPLPRPAAFAAAEDFDKVGLVVDVLDEGGDPADGRLPPQLGDEGEEGFRLLPAGAALLFPEEQRLVEAFPVPLEAEPGEVVDGEGKDRR